MNVRRGLRMRRVSVSLVLMSALTGCGLSLGDSRDRVGSHAFLARADHAAEHGGNRLVAGACPSGRSKNATAGAADRQHDMDALELPTWRSGDVGVTTPLSDGRVLWVFGDTTRTPGTSPRVVGNSMLVSSGRCFAELQTANEGAVVGGFARGRACWPNSAVTIPMRGADIVVVGCSRVDAGRGAGTGGLLDFTYAGLTVSTFVVRRGAPPQQVTQRDVVPDGGGAERINWGAAMVADGGWLYVYGTQQPRGSVAKGAYVARCRVAQINEPGRWHYWNGRDFDEGVDDARPFLAASEGVSQTFSVAAWRGEFLLVSKQGGEFGANIGVWSAPTPFGPWSGRRAVPEPFDQGGGVVAYQPLAHPELPTPSGSLLVTMSRTTTSIDDLLAHPTKGRPKFIEISLP